MWLSLKNSMGNTSQFMQMFAQFSEMRINHGILKGTMRYHEVPYSAIPGSAERIGDVMEEAGKARPSI